ncbi:hypothetical protein L596_012767 [Steinernema carpocapsae]|uniref:Uncharacterized protein n=1 Tax=Steinernema carpocapsae TaxID=34508 RepID=A0A4U5NYD8_STECR|nr:hypothetical protein L596_012767 [Steinernema carpocapsae]
MCKQRMRCRECLQTIRPLYTSNEREDDWFRARLLHSLPECSRDEVGKRSLSRAGHVRPLSGFRSTV